MTCITRLGLMVAALVATIAGCATVAGASTVYPTHVRGTPGYGCNRGALCIYPTADDFATGPDHQFYSYGAHDLHHELGVHLVYNNQYAVGRVNAGASFCLGYHGSGGRLNGGFVSSGNWSAIDLTSVNSVTLWLYESAYDRDFLCTM